MSEELQRPEALTPERKALILQALTEGNYLKTACLASGITYNGFLHWRQRWERGDEAAERHADFFRSVKTASALGEMGALRAVREGEAGWQGNAWFLERRFPARWGRKQTVRHEGAVPTKEYDVSTDPGKI